MQLSALALDCRVAAKAGDSGALPVKKVLGIVGDSSLRGVEYELDGFGVR